MTNAKINFNCSKEYSQYLHDIGSKLDLLFRKRSHTFPIHIQIACGMLSFPDLEKILRKKPHLASVRDDDGRVPLMIDYHDGLYDLLLKYGADPNSCDADGNTVLMYHRHNLGRLDYFIKAGADINAKNNNGETVLSMAFQEGTRIQPLLDLGAEWQPIPRTPTDDIFLNCLPHESIDVLRKIISDGAISNDTYLYAKIWSGCNCQEKFDWLKSIGKDYPLQRRNRLTEKEESIFAGGINCGDIQKIKQWLSNMAECVTDTEALLKHYISLHPQILSGITDNDILEFLLEAGADPNLGIEWKDDTDSIPLLYTAVSSSNSRAVKLLLAHGANPTVGTSYMDTDDTCIACAIRNNDLDILQMLIDAGADLDFAIRCNRTPVLTSIRENNLSALKMLISAGASLNPKDIEMYLGTINISPEISKYLSSILNHKTTKLPCCPVKISEQ